MSSFRSERKVITEIDEKSTISELIGLLMSSFQSKEFKLVEGILLKREDDLKTQLEKERENRCLFEGKHANTVLEIFGLQDDLKKLKDQNLELHEEMKILRMENLETARKFLECERRVAKLEKAMANAFTIDVSELQKQTDASLENVLPKKGNSNLDCEQILENASAHHNNAQASYGAPSPIDGPGSKINSGHVEEKGFGISYGCDVRTPKRRKSLMDDHSNAQNGIEGARETSKVPINSVKLKEENDSFHATAASKSIHKTCDTHRSPNVIEITESDDEAPAGEKPCVSSKRGVTFMQSGTNACPPDDKKERNVKKDPSFESLLLKRKKGLTETDKSGFSPVCKQRIETATELHHEGKGSTAKNCSVKHEPCGIGSQSGMPYLQSQIMNEQYQGIQKKLDFLSTDDSSDYSSNDSDDEISESHIKIMIEKLREDCQKSQN